MSSLPEVPVCRAIRIEKPVAVTGRLDDPQWEKAEVIELVETSSRRVPDPETGFELLQP